MLVAAETTDAEGAPRRWAVYDAGQAAAHLTAQASALGLSVRQMGGFRAADLPALPERVTPLVVVAVGVALAADRIPEGHPATRLPARDRRPRRTSCSSTWRDPRVSGAAVEVSHSATAAAQDPR